MKQTVTLCALLIFSMTAAAHHDGSDTRRRPTPPPPPPHDHPDTFGQIKELFNRDRLQQALIDDHTSLELL